MIKQLIWSLLKDALFLLGYLSQGNAQQKVADQLGIPRSYVSQTGKWKLEKKGRRWL